MKVALIAPTMNEVEGLRAVFPRLPRALLDDVIIEFPPDGSSMPESIGKLLAKIDEGYDLVIGSRYRDGAKSYDDDIVTRFGNWLFTTMINVLFGARYTDTLVGFRAYRRAAHDKLGLTTKGLSWTAQQSIQFAKARMKKTEVGVDEPARIGGVRKMHPIRTGIEILRVILAEWWAGKKFEHIFPVEK